MRVTPCMQRHFQLQRGRGARPLRGYRHDANLPSRGMICIADYIRADYVSGEKYEAVRAVNEFVRKAGYDPAWLAPRAAHGAMARATLARFNGRATLFSGASCPTPWPRRILLAQLRFFEDVPVASRTSGCPTFHSIPDLPRRFSGLVLRTACLTRIGGGSCLMYGPSTRPKGIQMQNAC